MNGEENENLEGYGNGCFLCCANVYLEIPRKMNCLSANGDAILKLSLDKSRSLLVHRWLDLQRFVVRLTYLSVL